MKTVTITGIIITVTVIISSAFAVTFLTTGSKTTSGTPPSSVSMTVTTNQSDYFGTEPIIVSGTVSPSPAIGSFVIISVTNPEGAGTYTGETSVNSTGFYSLTFAPSRGPSWITGSYVVDAVFVPAGGSPSASVASHFLYIAPA
jgi:hypothetical protein